MMQSMFFNSVSGDRRYKAEQFAEYFKSFIKNGVFPNPSTQLQVLAAENMSINVSIGKIWIEGFFGVNSPAETFVLDNADGVLPRIDRIVARWDNNARDIHLAVKKGDFSSTPVAQELQRDADAYEMALADVLVHKGATSITQADITDTRLNSELCGVAQGIIQQIDTTTLYLQIQAALAGFQQNEMSEFVAWFETIRDILDDNVAGNLLLLINNLTPAATATIEGETIVIQSANPRAGENYDVQFDAPEDFNETRLYTIDGTQTTLQDLNHEPLQDAWKTNAPVTLTRRGDKAFFKTGGSANLKVFAVAHEEDLLSIQPKTGTIALITSKKVQGWLIASSNSLDVNELGWVWLHLGGAEVYPATLSFGKTKKIILNIFAVAISNGTEFEDVEAFIFGNDLVWHRLHNLLFYAGNEFTATTGGYYMYTSSYGGTFTNTGTFLRLVVSQQEGRVGIRHRNNINFTGITSIEVTYTVTAVATANRHYGFAVYTDDGAVVASFSRNLSANQTVSGTQVLAFSTPQYGMGYFMANTYGATMNISKVEFK